MFVLLLNHTHAGVMELVDVPDSKSGEDHTSCRFDPDLRQTKKTTIKVVFLVYCSLRDKNRHQAELGWQVRPSRAKPRNLRSKWRDERVMRQTAF